MVLSFDPSKIYQVTDRLSDPHGDHFLYPHSSLSPLERELARQFQLLRAQGAEFNRRKSKLTKSKYKTSWSDDHEHGRARRGARLWLPRRQGYQYDEALYIAHGNHAHYFW